MRTFRRVFGIACFIWGAMAILWFFKLVSLHENIVMAGVLVMTAMSLIIDAIVARQEKRRPESGADS